MPVASSLLPLTILPHSVYPSFVLCISNCSPLFQRLSPVASTKMLQLFLAFSAPTFILAEEGNPRLVYYLYVALIFIMAKSLNADMYRIGSRLSTTSSTISLLTTRISSTP